MKRKTIRDCLKACVVLILLFVFVYSGLRFVESAVFLQQEEESVTRKTIERDGIEYFPRQDITVILLLGIGEWGEAMPSEPNEACAVDMITLLLFDEKQKDVTMLSLNRDTMLTMPKLDEQGMERGEAYRQLTYSHKFGTGMEDSCENVKKTVSNFLGGIRIDYYVSMRLDAISIVNDAVGGVTVTVTDDFADTDPTITKGLCTLRGKQAVTYVQSRQTVGDGLNVSRMNRQKDYMDALLGALREKVKESELFAVETYEKIAPYIVTDCSANGISGMMQRYSDYAVSEYVTPEGESVLGEKYYEFYPDEEKLDELIIRLFYAPK